MERIDSEHMNEAVVKTILKFNRDKIEKNMEAFFDQQIDEFLKEINHTEEDRDILREMLKFYTKRELTEEEILVRLYRILKSHFHEKNKMEFEAYKKMLKK